MDIFDFAARNCLLVLTVITTIAFTSGAVTQYGKEIGTFQFTAHQVAGTVYVIDEKRLYLKEFNYDGTAPAVAFYAGSTSAPSNSGTIIPDETGSTNDLRRYSNEDVMLTLPEGNTVNSFRWISIWCAEFNVHFGHVFILDNFVPPGPYRLGELGFSPRSHNVHANDVILMNSKQIKFVGLDYDGGGPTGYFWTGKGTPDSSDTRVPYPANEPDTILQRLVGETVTIILPGDLTVNDIDFIGLWCERFTQDFGHVTISRSAADNIPPYLTAPATPIPATNLDNCQVMLEKVFQIAWTVDEPTNTITLEFRGIVQTNDYMSFGISGSTTSTSMRNSDVAIVWIDPNTNGPKTADYYLNDYSQCTPNDGRGACPDTLQFGGTDDVVFVEGAVTNGVTIITVQRNINSTDPNDKDIDITGSDVFISWGIGSINPTGHVAKHDFRATGDVSVNFGSSQSTCPDFFAPSDLPQTVTPWVIKPFRPEGNATFIAHIGPAGGKRGYQGIADQVGWGLVWYINETIIPEIYLKRGFTYTFMVYGGDDNSSLGTYHPFYISDKRDGGWAQKSETDQQKETIYAEPVVGSLCEFEIGDSPAEGFDQFSEYKSTLNLRCPENSQPGVLVWTVPENAPNLLYYQCYQHRYFGWKINIISTSGVPFVLFLCLGIFIFLMIFVIVLQILKYKEVDLNFC